MSSDEISYLRERAAAERRIARTSANPVIAGIHEQMAELYDALIEHEEQQAKIDIVLAPGSASTRGLNGTSS